MKRSPMPRRRTPLRDAKPARYVCAELCAGDEVDEFGPTCSRCGGEAAPVVTGRADWGRRTRVRPVSVKRAAEMRVRRRNMLAAFGAEPPCARCGQRADDAHEIISRARGGSIVDPQNVLPLCRPCHTWVTEHPVEAEQEGLSKPSWARTLDEALLSAERTNASVAAAKDGLEEALYGRCVVCGELSLRRDGWCSRHRGVRPSRGAA